MLQFHVIFDDGLEADYDVEEDEMEEPILEEDEEEGVDSPLQLQAMSLKLWPFMYTVAPDPLFITFSGSPTTIRKCLLLFVGFPPAN